MSECLKPNPGRSGCAFQNETELNTLTRELWWELEKVVDDPTTPADHVLDLEGYIQGLVPGFLIETGNMQPCANCRFLSPNQHVSTS